MKIIVEARHLFGSTLFYPNNDTSKKLCTLISRRSFTKVQLEIMRQIGFTIEVDYEKMHEKMLKQMGYDEFKKEVTV